MLSRTTLSLLAGAALIAVLGGLFGSAPATGGGCLVAFGVLAAQRSVPLRIRVMLCAGLALLGVAVVRYVWDWADPMGGGVDTAELVARIKDPAWQRARFQRDLLVAGCLAAGFGILAGTTVYLSRGRLRAVPVPVAATLMAMVALVLVPVLGSFTNMVVGTAVLVGGYLWVMRRAVRGYGAVPVAVAGSTVLATVVWQAVDLASRNRPRPVEPGVFYAVAVAVDTGPDVELAVEVGLLLLAASAVVLACGRLSRDRA
ncbi:hypothetical protein BJY16_005987 [Actinoplanes octamycinicus]|uniref:Uncharacterized protein n=1 Tax=Actinoplanes octamycinicus TaxID=135948 RepID=A0A7W7H205_9ACTN|nr:hypothetical protein [Actinoplanes octamycinicus]MBB4742528.1 hypothetical protein [Actinoplanes octamycinicus]GIE60866.1 hypothetical protein Aoc01nite_62680 [Actinoplanes octamycinicus]